MKPFLFTLILAFIFPVYAFSQGFILEGKLEGNLTRLRYDWNSYLIDMNRRTELNLNLSLGLSTQVYKYFYLKATFGTSDVRRHEMYVEYYAPIGYKVYKFNVYTFMSASQLYLEVLPELRLFNDYLYFNVGVGVFKLYNFKIIKGQIRAIRSLGNEQVILEPFRYPEKVYPYFSMNIGTNIQFNQLGIILEYGYKNSGFIGRDLQKPGIGFKQYCFKIGLSYTISSE